MANNAYSAAHGAEEVSIAVTSQEGHKGSVGSPNGTV